jgi:hypothetical protein
MAVLICEDCGSRFVEDAYPPRRLICFKCHLKGIRLGFRHGKEDFHGPTIRERQQKIVREAEAKGITAVPASDYGF